jgi:membrane protein YdbS with pleckstrin-like domain
MVIYILRRHKMSDNTNNTSGGIGFVGLLTIVFIILKLTKVISWSWWWVISPIWISIALGLLIVLLPLIIIWIIGVFKR